MTPLRQQMHEAMLVRGLAKHPANLHRNRFQIGNILPPKPRRPDSGTGRCLVTVSDPRPQAV